MELSKRKERVGRELQSVRRQYMERELRKTRTWTEHMEVEKASVGREEKY